MSRYSDRITRPFTSKHVFALVLLAVLASTNFLLVRTELQSSQAMASILNKCERQRILLHRTAMLAERLVFASDATFRDQLRHELASATEPLETTHLELMLPDSEDASPPEERRANSADVPCRLVSEMRNYVLHLQAIAKGEDLEYGNVHFKYVRDPETIDQILEGLDAVAADYEQRSEATTARLRFLAIWSLASTLVVLLLDSWFVFRPMVRRVRQDVDDLNILNKTLDKRVAERTAEAERSAEQLAESEGALRDSEALYRSLVNNLPMCVLRKDLLGRFTFANAEFCRLVGRALDEIVGCTDADLYPSELADKYQADDDRVIHTEPVLLDVERHRSPRGSDLYVEVMKAPLRDAAGNTIGTQTVFWDVTAREEAEQRARHAERLAAIGQMVAGVAHESRNALQQIQACSRLLEWELDGDLSKRALIADLQAAQDRLHRLFDELREYSSPLKLDVRPCSISAVLIQAWSSLKSRRNGREVSLQDFGQASLECLADPFHMEQVFRNILENSLAACDDPVRIEVVYNNLSDDDSCVARITIRDNGPGLSKEQRERMFEPFFTTKTQGTGLGMAIVRQIIDVHGGTIDARCGERGGTEIVITLPIAGRPLPTNPTIAEEYYA